jgi:dienelactone hydrolase
MNTPRITLLSLLLVLVAVPLSAQEKRSLEHADADRWNRIQNDITSKDAAWLAYRLVPGDGDGTMVLRYLQDDRSITIERGDRPTFSADSRYLVAHVVPMEEAVDAAREGGDSGRNGESDQPHDSLVIVQLSTLSVTRVADVSSFRLPEDEGGWMAYLLEADDEEDEDSEQGDDEEEDDAGAPRLDDGTTLVVRALSSEREWRFEAAVEYAFSADGTALFYTASGADGAADGVFRVDDEGASEAVSTGEGRYVDLTVSDDGTAAFLTDRDDRDDEAPNFALYVSTKGGATSRAGTATPGLPAGWAPSENGDVSFSESGSRVFFGATSAPEPEPKDETPEDDRVVVDIWNWKDPYLQPMQLLQRDQEESRTYQAMFDIESGRVVQLETESVPSVSVAERGDGAVALGSSNLDYRQLISWEGRYNDLFIIDVEDGTARLVAEMVRGGASLSPSGAYATWWDGFETAWMAYDVQSGETINLTENLGVPVHDLLDDHPDALRAYGSAGWTEGDELFVVYDEFDVWGIDPSGHAASRNLTEGVGRRSDIRFRVVDLDADDPYVPSDSDVYLSAFDVKTKASGVYRDRFGSNRVPERLVMDDARLAAIRKAETADVILYERSTFEEFPDVWVADADFEDARKVTDANPQQDEYLWGSAELVDWTSTDGIPLQGILYKPEGFDPSKQYPMMVYFYERNSDGLHSYTVPAAGGSSINRSFYVSRGYLLFVPDIPYRIGYPGESALDAVVPGVLSLVEEGFVDRDKIGMQGHSWGGYQIAYMVTRTDLFAAVEAGAPVANMVSAYGGIRWGTGMSRMFQYEHTQSRIGGSLWEKPLRFIENSPIFTADKIRTPMLMMHNDQDTAVPWEQGIELFVALRRLGQPAWLLNYNGEPHGLRKSQNQKDWATRMQQFFDHYLMDAPAPVWMEDGVPAILKGKELGLGLKRVISEQDETR